MTVQPRRIILVLGIADTGVERIARTLAAAGAMPALDASDAPGSFGASVGIERFAERLCADLRITPGDPGPLAVGGKSLAESRTAIADHLSNRVDAAAALVETSLPSQGTIVLTGAFLSLLPRFWRRVLTVAGIDARIILADRNPLALVDIARAAQQRNARRTLFLWHYRTLHTLAAAPDATIVPADSASPRPLLEALDLTPNPHWAGPPMPRQPREKATPSAFPVVSPQSLALHDLLLRWNGLDRAARSAATADLVARLDDAMAVTGLGRQVQADRAAKPAQASGVAAPPPPSSRPLLIHYHLFKNAGTSVDAMLRDNFGGRWAEQEFARGKPAEKHAALIAHLVAHPDLAALSSHTALLPPPVLAGREVFPIIFVRHPLLRLRSAYAFERAQDAETTGALLAKRTDFAGYVTTILEEPRNRQARNFHIARFAFGSPGKPDREVERAMATEAALPFVGLVERYERSIERLGALIAPLFPDFRPTVFHRNVTDGEASADIDAKIDRLRSEIGEALYERLVSENRGDLALFDRVRARYPDA